MYGITLKKNVRGQFDPATGTVYLRKNATDLEAFHEFAHLKQWKKLGKKRYLKQNRFERENHVLKEIMKNKDKFNPEQIRQPQGYVEGLK